MGSWCKEQRSSACTGPQAGRGLRCPGWMGELMDTYVPVPWLQREPLQPEAQEQP